MVGGAALVGWLAERLGSFPLKALPELSRRHGVRSGERCRGPKKTGTRHAKEAGCWSGLQPGEHATKKGPSNLLCFQCTPCHATSVATAISTNSANVRLSSRFVFHVNCSV